jgi:hypothetical protein
MTDHRDIDPDGADSRAAIKAEMDSGSSHGQLLFALMFIVLAVFLLSQLGEQTKFSSKGKLFAQPAFWPAVGVIGMVFFGALHLVARLLDIRKKGVATAPTTSPGTTDKTAGNIFSVEFREGARWLLAFEYLGWFMVYVYVTPKIGYLLSTIIFLVLLTWRSGYRSKRMLLIAAAVGFAIVLVFKSFLGVKIPGGAVYEALPDAIRSFMIVNF